MDTDPYNAGIESVWYLQELVSQSQIVLSAIYGSDTVIT